ncbi:Acetophenone carboxylase gamma subunit [Acaryochloris thomasi RCC1774]|uniref:Acetophenone carboxylase gamma subunit n=1 Tax=Acaryochloris thomasi RCC1774 TaxID=1764569 RepID=A0A2W1JPW9_9CYAN|nr:hydantoinase B/oxoprolinase family protein [Acaryochloris thomasi]PZD70947.1 Acetophenone carboxylase gamma subunit [Acaryochloris thomasi RCC1774]
MTNFRWQFWIDRGGTFTDIVARKPDGSRSVHKLLSENPSVYPDAALQGIRELMGIKADQPLPTEKIEVVKMGTTVATNALLERKGDRNLLITTKGFADLLRIGDQHRPDIFALEIVLPEMLYEQVVEVNERYSAHGEELQPVDLEAARADLQVAYDDGIRSCAIACLHSYRYPDHEQQVADLAKEMGFTQISVSHQISPLIKLVSRGDTTVVDAYLSPILRRYVNRTVAELGDTRLMFMQSSGGLVDAQYFQGKDSILSGPAGGVVGAVQTCALAGRTQLIGFDMGGTSTDVCHYQGSYERVLETELTGVRLRTPMLDIHTVAAGGGSILNFDGSRFRVGPESAGASPGPTCYRQSGPLTVTDCNVMVGKIQPQFFPQVFGPEHNLPLDIEPVQRAFAKLARRIQSETKQVQTPEQVAAGFLTIAVENMANAIKKISLQRGHDVSDYTLCCFGSAGGQHVCQIAEVLGIQEILIHPFAGVLSAFGMGLADLRASRQQTVEVLLSEGLTQLESDLEKLKTMVANDLLQQGVVRDEVELRSQLYLRYTGTDAPLLVDLADPAMMQAEFETLHQQRYGFIVSDRALIVESLSVEGIATTPKTADLQDLPQRSRPAQAISSTQIFTYNRWHETLIYQRQDLRPGDQIDGPALIMEATGTNVIEPGWQAQVIPQQHLLITRSAAVLALAPAVSEALNPKPFPISSDTPDPVLLEIFNNLFRAIAEQMGVTLQNTSYSVNIKERLDFSCALFDGKGQLIANAPHIPVHLGSMEDSVQSVIETAGDRLQQGDVYVLNDPYSGGTHLPDITVVTPVFIESERLFYVASRGHHADIGGITPGSMPAHSKSLEEEGVLIAPFRVVEQGKLQAVTFRRLLTEHPHPARNPDQNLADLQAQIAANQCGVQELLKMVNHYGLSTVQTYMEHVQQNAEQSVRRVIDHLQDGQFTYVMDGERQIQVAITVHAPTRSARVDFSGTSPQQDDNFNAPVAIAKAAVLYVFRTLVSTDIPLNAGCLKPIEIYIPEDCFLNPKPPAAIVAGNVETSQAIVNALYGALGKLAASQGTMNNLTFGNENCQYYETICGGSGAGPNFNGADAVQTHMTNSRLTDPEILEWRFPVRLEHFGLRPQSGGQGQYSGGDGVIRQFRFLEPMTVSILSGHRRVAPFGLQGGQSGKTGQNQLKHQGHLTKLAGCTTRTVQIGDTLTIKTPGGGGYFSRAEDQTGTTILDPST